MLKYDWIIRAIRKNRTLLLVLASLVVIVTTYMLVLPAFTLDANKAKEQGGIDVGASTKELEFDGGSYTVKCTLNSKDAASDKVSENKVSNKQDAKDANEAGIDLSVKELTKKDKDYSDYVKKAEEVVAKELDKDDSNKKIAESSIYDISLMSDGKEKEPEEPVSVTLEYDKIQKMSGADDVRIVHFAVNNGKETAEVLDSDDVSIETKKDGIKAVNFKAESFSVYAIVYTVKLSDNDNEDRKIEVHNKNADISASDDTYEITVTYDDEAKISENAELKVKEILPGDDKYADYYEKSLDKIDAYDSNITNGLSSNKYANVFDIEIWDGGQKIEPEANVSVSIKLLDVPKENDDLKVVHFAEDGPEVLKTENNSGDSSDEVELSFTTDAFSVYTVVSVSDFQTAIQNGPYALISEKGTDINSADHKNSVSNFAMISSLSGGTLSGKGVYMDTSVTPNTVGGYVTEWGFESAGNNQYYIYTMLNGAKKYIRANGDNLELTDNQSNASMFYANVSNNKVSLSIGQSWSAKHIKCEYDNSHKSAKFILTNNQNEADHFTLSKVDPNYEEKTAKKVSAENWKAGSGVDGNWNENDTIIIYRKIVHADGSESLYALATDGTLIPVYDGGDSIYYHCPQGKNLNWHVSMSDGGYHVASVVPEGSSEEVVYLSPSVTNNTWCSDSIAGLTMNGLGSNYGTAIEKWDQQQYAYAGLHVDNTNIGQGIQPGSGENSDTFLFAVSDTLITEGRLHTVDTVNSTDLGITMKIFNYGGPTYNYGYRNGAMQAVMGDDMLSDWDNRKSHVTKTVDTKLGDDGFPVSLSNGKSYAPLFTDGSTINYPAYSHPQGYEDGYAAGSITVQGSDANNLFLQTYYDESQMFRYSSMENFAHFNTSGSNQGNFTVYREAGTPNIPTQNDHYYYYHGHFMPYNELDPTISVSRIVDQYGSISNKEQGRSFENVYGLKETPDYYVGMTLEANFMQPRGGTLDNGDPVIYRFTGDDDLLVYIDGILVLDVGGIHEPLTGSINFETGVVTQPNFYGEGDGWKTHTTTLYEIFKDAHDSGKISDADWNKIKWKEVDGQPATFADYSSHKLNMFYMERGAGASNLDLAFNLQVIKSNEFTVKKELPKEVDERFANQKFRFRATYMDGDIEKPLYKDVVNTAGKKVCTKVIYKDRKDNNGHDIEVPVDSNGYFYLKAGEAAIFTLADEQIVYNVKEVDIDQYNLESITIEGGGEAEHIEINDQQAQIQDNTAPAGFEAVKDRGNVLYTNYPEKRSLLITKHIGDYNDQRELVKQEYPENLNPVFEFRVYMERTGDSGNTKLVPYSYAPYYLTKEVDGVKHYYTLTKGTNNAPEDKGTTPVFCSETGRSGSINSIPPEYVIEIPNLLIGTHFYVEERRDNIPNDFQYVTEELTDGTYDVATLTHIERLIARDETDHQEFDPNTVGKIKSGIDAKSHIWNKYRKFEIKVKKNWVGNWSDNDKDKVDDAGGIRVILKRYKLVDKANLKIISNVTKPDYMNYHADYSIYDENDTLVTSVSTSGEDVILSLPDGTYKVVQSTDDPDSGFDITHEPVNRTIENVVVEEEQQAETVFTSSYIQQTGNS